MIDENPEGMRAALPVLGEVLAVELANTRYATGDANDADFLDGPGAIEAWVRAAPAAADIDLPVPLGPAVAARFRGVRDAARHVLGDLADGVGPDRRAADVLHEASRAVAAHVALDLSCSPPSWSLHHDGPGDAVAVAVVAARCVLFIGGEQASWVRRCARPGCPLLFVQRHRARRFCQEACAHSMRQSRYQDAKRSRRT